MAAKEAGAPASPAKKQKTNGAKPTTEAQVQRDIEEICKLAKLDPPVVDSKLAEQVTELEKELGFSVPKELRLFWSLPHTKHLRGVEDIEGAIEHYKYSDNSDMMDLFGEFRLVPTLMIDCQMAHEVFDMASGQIVLMDHECGTMSVMHKGLAAYTSKALELANVVAADATEMEPEAFFEKLNSLLQEASEATPVAGAIKQRLQRFHRKWSNGGG
ncbi:hypothetical protein DIPPA_13879 [Diplonema papillatum]|nr:hypothetical protein DIPPA_13879 [Diplonema papillatum]